jgi:short subunit dehydrogenase-like uncharacterized protein
MTMATSKTALIYGATGYTGHLLARYVRDYGLNVILGGRNEAKLARLAAEHDLPYRVFDLSDGAAVRRGLDGMAAVLHCAGPFIHTFQPMAAMCLATGTHYLDLTGEVEVIEALAACDHLARDAGVMLMPAVGFDVVPSDCLAAHLASCLPTATNLAIAFKHNGRISRGTAASALQHLARGSFVRRNGRLATVPMGSSSRRIAFDGDPVSCILAPLADVATAFRTTGIPNIETYISSAPGMAYVARLGQHIAPLVERPAIRRFVIDTVLGARELPDEAELEAGSVTVWGRVSDEEGRAVEGLVRGPDVYLITAYAALEILRRTLEDEAQPGFRTPGGVFGPELIDELPDVRFIHDD